MAVYFQPQYKPWWADLANTALKEGLSGLMKGMFERDAYARQKNRSNKEWAQVFGTPAQQVAAQEATQQPAAMTVESSPDTNRLSSAITGATQTSPFGSDAIGFAPNAPKVNVPKQFLPTANDGLLGTSNKAVMANNYVNSQVPSREELMRRVLTTMGPQNQEAAVKYLEYMYGPQWKVGDQIYRGRQMENVLGALPGMQDKEGNRNYNNRAYMYGMDNLATGNLNFINPEYQRWFNESEAAKQRAFLAGQQQRQFANQMRLARFNNSQANYRAQIAQAARAAAGRNGAGNANIAKLAAPYEKMLAKTADNLGEYNWNDFETGVRAQYQDNPEIGEAILQYLSGRQNVFAPMDNDNYEGTPTKANPYAGRYKALTPAYTPGSISVQGSAPQRVTYDALGLSGAGAPGGIPMTPAPTAAAPTTGAIPRSAVEAFMKQTGITDYKTAEAALMRGIQNY